MYFSSQLISSKDAECRRRCLLFGCRIIVVANVSAVSILLWWPVNCFFKYKHKSTNWIQAWLLTYLLKSPFSMGWVDTWRQHFESGHGCPHPHWMGMFHWGWRRWWHLHSTCLGSGCSPCSSAPQVPGRPECPPLSAWKTSPQWSEQTRNHTVLPGKKQWVLRAWCWKQTAPLTWLWCNK